jgi:hypothetical protein
VDCRFLATPRRITPTSQIFACLALLTRLKPHNNSGMRGLISRLFAVPFCLALLAMAACSGSMVVTLTATPSSDNFVAYRVGLASVQLQTSSGKTGLTIVPTETTVDFSKLFDFSELLGAPNVAKGTYTGAVITLDYSAAEIIYDDGSLDGVQLTPVDANGKALGLVSVTVTLDPSDPFRSAAKQVGILALNFNLAASNVVDLSARTVTITPMVAGSTLPIDAKPVRVRGPLMSANTGFISTGISPFDSTVAGLGDLSLAASDTTTYEINGLISVGTEGQAQLAALPASTTTIAFGTLPSTDTAATTHTTSTVATSTRTTDSTVSFTVSQVLVDSSGQGLGLDRVSGVVSARSGNTLGIEEATLIQSDGTNTLVPGTTVVNLGPNTLVTFFGQDLSEVISPQQISVGSLIDAFGASSSTSTGEMFLDASAGRVRLDLTTASGLVSALGDSAVTLNLTALGGRDIGAFDFAGSGAAPTQYAVATGDLSLANAAAAAPVVVTGFANAFGTTSPNFTAATLLDPTTIDAELVIDWSGGTAAPFASFDSTGIALNAANSGIGPRHQIQIGAQIIDLVGLATQPLITASTSVSTTVFSIGHASSSTVENFNTYTAFITQLQSELNGATLAVGMTAVGQFTVSTSAFSATSITLFLNN